MTYTKKQPKWERLILSRMQGNALDRSDNVIIGTKRIMRYIGLANINAFYRWIEMHGFPAILRPDGTWMTTVTAVDEWLWNCLFSQQARQIPTVDAIAAKVAHNTGLLDQPMTQSERANEYKRRWEEKTGKNCTHYKTKAEMLKLLEADSRQSDDE